MPTNVTYQSWSFNREFSNMIYYFDRTTQALPERLTVAAVTTAVTEFFGYSSVAADRAFNSYSDVFGGSPVLLRSLIYLMLLDFILGIVRSFILRGPDGKRELSAKIFARGITKYPIYVVYVLLVATVGSSIEHAIGFGSGILVLNLFVSYLIVSEAASIILSLKRLNVSVPPILLYVVYGFRNRLEKAIKDKVGSPIENPIPPDIDKEDHHEHRNNV